MRFNSIEFLLFFPLVSFAFYLVPHKVRWLLLLGASYFFYLSWKPKYILVLLAITGISYLSGLWLGRDKNPSTRRFILIISLAAQVGILFFFKFFDEGRFSNFGRLQYCPEN